MGVQRLQRRGAVYYFRAKIPKDLRHIYAPKSEIHFSLHTSEHSEAKRLVLLHSVRLDEEFDGHRKRLQDVVARERAAIEAREGPERPLIVVDEVTDSLIDLICRSRVRLTYETYVSVRSDEVFREILSKQRHENLPRYREWLASGSTRDVVPLLLEQGERFGFALSEHLHGFHRLAHAFLQALIQESEMLNALDRGEIVDPEAIAPIMRTVLKERRTKGTRIETLHDHWLKHKPRRPKTVRMYKADLAQFENFVARDGKRFVEDLVVEDFRRFKEALQQEGVHFRTIRRKLGSVRTMFNLAANRGLIPSNPCGRVDVDRPTVVPVPRMPFDAADLNAIFQSPVYTKGYRARGAGGEALFWLPLLAAFSGAREEELAQLAVGDLKKTKYGWMLMIIDDDPTGESGVDSASDEGDAATRSLKTEASRRRLPIHCQVIRCGILEYIQKIRDAGGTWLFPDLKLDSDGRRSTNFSKAFHRYLRGKVKISSSKKVFHSFRHTFKDACREAELPRDITDALMGHRSARSVGDGYGSKPDFSTRQLFDAMGKIEIDGLDLSHLYVEARSPSSGPPENRQD